MPPATPIHAALPTMRVLRVGGADAMSFLHGQLTSSLQALGAARGGLTAWLDARGRARAVFEVFVGAGDGFVLLCPADIADAVLAKLGRYVLRSRVTLDADAERRVDAVIGDTAAWLAAGGVELGPEPWALAQTRGIHWLRLGPELVHAVGAPAALEERLAALESGDPAAAELAEIELGIPAIRPGTEEKYIPQMLNLDRLGAVAFDKGCYPGQEIVARTQNLGSVKRRAKRFAAAGVDAAALAPGTALEDPAGRAVGEVIRAASAAGRTELLAVVALDRAGTPLTAAGAALEPLPLPFE